MLSDKLDRNEFLDVFEVAIQGKDFAAEFLGNYSYIAIKEMDRFTTSFFVAAIMYRINSILKTDSRW